MKEPSGAGTLSFVAEGQEEGSTCSCWANIVGRKEVAVHKWVREASVPHKLNSDQGRTQGVVDILEEMLLLCAVVDVAEPRLATDTYSALYEEAAQESGHDSLDVHFHNSLLFSKLENNLITADPLLRK